MAWAEAVASWRLYRETDPGHRSGLLLYYHLTQLVRAIGQLGMTLVESWCRARKPTDRVVTPFGDIRGLG